MAKKQILMVQDWIRSFGIDMVERKPKKLVQLACDVENFNGANIKRLSDIHMVMDKLDGVYALVPCIRDDNGTWHVKHFGRSGKQLSGCEDLDAQLISELTYTYGRSSGYSMVLISEVTSHGPLAKLSGYLTPTRKVEKDIPEGLGDNFHEQLSLAEFVEGIAPRTAIMRHECLMQIAKDLDLETIPYSLMDYDEAESIFESIVEAGGEGIIGRDPSKPWVAGQKNEVQWKMKERIDFECEIVGWCTGKRGSKYEQVAGKVLVAYRAFGRVDGKLILLPVGSGLTDEERERIAKDPSTVLGRIIKVKAKSYTEFGNLREPVIEEWRSDKDEGDFPFERGVDTIQIVAGSTWYFKEIRDVREL